MNRHFIFLTPKKNWHNTTLKLFYYVYSGPRGWGSGAWQLVRCLSISPNNPGSDVSSSIRRPLPRYDGLGVEDSPVVIQEYSRTWDDTTLPRSNVRGILFDWLRTKRLNLVEVGFWRDGVAGVDTFLTERILAGHHGFSNLHSINSLMSYVITLNDVNHYIKYFNEVFWS